MGENARVAALRSPRHRISTSPLQNGLPPDELRPISLHSDSIPPATTLAEDSGDDSSPWNAFTMWVRTSPLKPLVITKTRMITLVAIVVLGTLLSIESRFFTNYDPIRSVIAGNPLKYCNMFLVGSDPCVMDVGFHHGYASQVYLKEGYRVVGIESNPELLGRGHSSLAEFVLRDRLRLLGIGIFENANREVPFYVNKNDAWSSFDVKWGCRNDMGQSAEVVEAKWCSKVNVRTTTCADLVDRFGTPTYMRVSLENKEWACLDSLRSLSRSELPEFTSVSNSDLPFLDLLLELGYRKFKVVDMYYEQSKTTDELRAMGTSASDWGHSVLHMRRDARWRSYHDIKDAMPFPKVDKASNETLWYSLHGYREY